MATENQAKHQPNASADLAALLRGVAAKAEAAGVFGTIRVDGSMLRCDALASAEPAEFRVFIDEGKLFVALVTEHRWLSQSIEADLVHTGDKIDELVEEELLDLGYPGLKMGEGRWGFEHFRDPQKLYTFRTALPIDPRTLASPDTIHRAAIALLAYEQAFRPLGDMEADEE
ncbi:MAG: hypothetical protein K2W85_15200 [Phycisphaerales bacterium]|nr:hypothetical protein [Phycisphaerales bacterium]